jgi:hypothetical protein
MTDRSVTYFRIGIGIIIAGLFYYVKNLFGLDEDVNKRINENNEGGKSFDPQALQTILTGPDVR